MTLIQITRRTGTIKRVPRGEKPIVELHLKPCERLLNFSLREAIFDRAERKTVDWHWEADIEWRSEEAEE